VCHLRRPNPASTATLPLGVAKPTTNSTAD
jgi:hypothetical protein